MASGVHHHRVVWPTQVIKDRENKLRDLAEDPNIYEKLVRCYAIKLTTTTTTTTTSTTTTTTATVP